MSFNVSTFIIALLAFGILYFLLARFAFGPLFAMLEKRKAHVMGQIESAESNRVQSDKLLVEMKQAIQDARQEAYAIIEQSRVTSTKQADEIIQQARNEATRQKEDALKEIESEKNKAIAALRDQVSEMAIFIASKIVEKQVDEQSQKQIIEQYLKQVGGNGA
ncbi:MAG TPA: F0F1 ATP synthase subunit B [Bacilli bacterium]